MVFSRYKPSKSRNIKISGKKIMVSPPGVELGLPGWNPHSLLILRTWALVLLHEIVSHISEI